MTDEGGQRTLEGLIVTDPETLKELLREVLREEGAAEPWSHKYLGDPFWLEARARVLKLITVNVAISRRDIDQDPFLMKYFPTYVQWDRACTQRFLANRPAGPDGLDLTTFSLSPRRGTYLTRRDWLHCAIQRVAERHSVRDPDLVRKTRRSYHAGSSCQLCAKTTGVDD